MKGRAGFVSNSSSSSFVISLFDLTPGQTNKIQNHIHFAQEMDNIEFKNDYDAWCVEVDDEKGTISGHIPSSTISTWRRS